MDSQELLAFSPKQDGAVFLVKELEGARSSIDLRTPIKAWNRLHKTLKLAGRTHKIASSAPCMRDSQGVVAETLT
eukprot:7366263-Pyramimonas_sp.AAC.1